jgi:hypothetical protein
MSLPHISAKATTEQDKHSNLFLKAFPWLFPGGIGGYGQYIEEKLSASIGKETCAIPGGWPIFKRQNVGILYFELFGKTQEPNFWWLFC